MKYFAYVAELNCSFGHTNPNTGLCSTHHNLYKFDDRATRDKFCDTQYISSFNQSPEPCPKRLARKLNRGMTVRNFDEYLEYMNTIVWDDDLNTFVETN